MDSDDQAKGGKSEKDFTIKFKVFEHMDRSKGCSVLKLAKSDAKRSGEPSCEPIIRLGTYHYPNVSIIRENAANKHAVDMMFSLNHQNILSVKAVGPKVKDDVLLFIEECDGILDNVIGEVINDQCGRIPSETCQSIVLQIIEGVEFLRRNEKYHGDLTWKKTLYKHPYIVKLCNFKTHDSMSKEDAQWRDWMSIRQMLQELSDYVVLLNQEPERVVILHSDMIDGLIALIEGSDRSSLHRMKDIVLEDVFFWTRGKRARFIMSTISDLIRDSTFCEAVNNSNVCDTPWDSHNTNGSLDGRLEKIFSAVLDHCIQYRDGLVPKPPALNRDKKSDCVKLICAAYTHQYQEDFQNICQGNLDLTVCLKYHRLFVELNRLVKARQLGSRPGSSSSRSKALAS